MWTGRRLARSHRPLPELAKRQHKGVTEARVPGRSPASSHACGECAVTTPYDTYTAFYGHFKGKPPRDPRRREGELARRKSKHRSHRSVLPIEVRCSRPRWQTPVMPAVRRAETGGFQVQGQPAQFVSKKKKKLTSSGDAAQHSLGSVPNTARRRSVSQFWGQNL